MLTFAKVQFEDEIDYLYLLSRERLVSPRTGENEEVLSRSAPTEFDLGQIVKAIQSLGNYRTCNPSLYHELQQGEELLRQYFEPNKPQKRPLNSLLLGPPGSGKTFLAKKLGSTLENSVFLDYNLAQLDHPGRIAEIFREIGQIGRRTEAPKIVFLDEFDVTIGGTSMIRYLIHSMYEGKFGEGQDLKKTAFIFSGSYLKNKQLLSVLQKNASDFDFIHFLYDIYLHLPNQHRQRRNIRDFFDLSRSYREARNQMSPDRDALDYLRRLDKLTDFLSRINGFVIEIPDVSAPLEITDPPFIVSMRDEFQPGIIRIKNRQNKSAARDILNFVQSREKLEVNRIRAENPTRYSQGVHYITKYKRNPIEPVLDFKNMLLKERLARVVLMLEERFKSGQIRSLRVPRKMLNYLTVVPLIHGMRSLEYLIGQVTLRGDIQDEKPLVQWIQSDLDDEIDRMHIRVEGEYRGENSIWAAMRNANPNAFDPARRPSMLNELIEIAL